MYTYADAGILSDCSDIVDEANYSEIAVENARGSAGMDFQGGSFNLIHFCGRHMMERSMERIPLQRNLFF